MGIIKLKLSMLGTLVLVIGLSSLVFSFILLSSGFSITILIVIVLVFNIIQWLYAPKLINSIYKIKNAEKSEYPELHRIVENLCNKMKIKKPNINIADMPFPNAFAYGSPMTGNSIAFTKKILNELENEEIEAVAGHELGHLKNKDVQLMTFVSVLPAIISVIAYSFIFSGMFGGMMSGRRQNSGGMMVIGMMLMAFYWILTLIILNFGRLREYYADQKSIQYVNDGSRKLSEALAKISHSNAKYKSQQFTKSKQRSRNSGFAFKTLFISDPETAIKDELELEKTKLVMTDQQLVKDILKRKISMTDKMFEMFSTHPNIVKRLKTLRSY